MVHLDPAFRRREIAAAYEFPVPMHILEKLALIFMAILTTASSAHTLAQKSIWLQCKACLQKRLGRARGAAYRIQVVGVQLIMFVDIAEQESREPVRALVVRIRHGSSSLKPDPIFRRRSTKYKQRLLVYAAIS